MVELARLPALKSELLAEWDRPDPAVRQTDYDDVEFEATKPRSVRGGLSVGHSFTASGDIRLEMRVTAAAGPYHARAEAIARRARSRGIETNMLVRGRPRIGLPEGGSGAMPPPAIKGLCEPLHLGASVAHINSAGAGSVGGFVRLRDGSAAILSCAHVLARPRQGVANKGDAVRQPGPPDAYGRPIAHLTDRFAPLVAGGKENLDAAIARIADDIDHTGNHVPDLGCVPADLRGRPLGVPLGEDELMTGIDVIKIGHQTGYTEAMVNALELQNVRVNAGKGSSVYVFEGVHEVVWQASQPRFTAPGDSGALVLTKVDLRPVGLHFSAIGNSDGSGSSYVVPWWRIAAMFKVQWL